MLTLDQKDRYSLLIIYEVGNIMTTLVKMDNILPLRGVSEDPNEKFTIKYLPSSRFKPQSVGYKVHKYVSLGSSESHQFLHP